MLYHPAGRRRARPSQGKTQAQRDEQEHHDRAGYIQGCNGSFPRCHPRQCPGYGKSGKNAGQQDRSSDKSHLPVQKESDGGRCCCGWGRSNNKELSPNFAQLKNNKSLPEKVLFILRAIIPPRSRLSWLYGVPLASPKIWLYYPIHLKKIIGRNARRTWQLLRGNARVTNAASRRVQLAEWLARAE